jgi:ATP-binding cassette subfamily B protein
MKQVANPSLEQAAEQLHDWSLLRRLLLLLKPYSIEVTASVVLALGATWLQILNPLLLSIAIDRYFLHRKPALAWLGARLPADTEYGLALLSMLFFIVILLAFICESLQAYLAQSSGQKAMADLRHAIFWHLQRLPIAYYDVTPTGRLVTRATSDIEALNDLYTNGIVSVLANAVMTIFFLAATACLNPRLSIVLGAVLPVFAVLTLYFRRVITLSQQQGRILLARINGFIAENISGIDVVHLFNRQAPQLERFDRMNAGYNTISMQWVTANAWFMPVIELLGTLSQAGLLFLGAWLLQRGELSIGIIVAFLQYATRFLKPIQEMGERYGVLQSSVVSAEKVFALLDTPAHKEENGEDDAEELEASIEFDHVWFAYKTNEWILRDLSFRIPAGETLAIVGHTGAGKTTIINLLLRFYEPQRGTIRVGGVDVRELPPNALRRRFGVVLQESYVREGSLLDNLRFGAPVASEEKLRKVAGLVGVTSGAGSLLHGMDAFVQERGDNLSAGQKQMLALARAMAHDPELLILDEATSNVDTETETRMQQAIHDFLRNKTSIVIAHRLATILRADNIIVMHKGRLAESGNHSELMNRCGLYWNLCRLQYGDEVGS